MPIRVLRVAAVVAALIAAAPARAELLISIDKTAQQLTVDTDGERLYTWPVSSGGHGYATPSGEFRALSMERHHFSREWDDAPMPHSIFFTRDGHAIHGSYEVKRLGRAVSHGCVRLAPANAATLFGLVKQAGLAHTRVVVSGDAPAPAIAEGTPRILAEEEADAPRPRRARDGWNEYRDGSRYNYYRSGPLFSPRGIFGAPFGWRN